MNSESGNPGEQMYKALEQIAEGNTGDESLIARAALETVDATGLRSKLNLDTGDLDALQRIAGAKREIAEIADALINSRTSKREQRHELGRRLNAVKASLTTVEMRLSGDMP